MDKAEKKTISLVGIPFARIMEEKLASRQVIDIIGNINVPVLGGDVVEYNPGRDVSGITSALAAKLVKEILSKMVLNLYS